MYSCIYVVTGLLAGMHAQYYTKQNLVCNSYELHFHST